MATIKKTVNSRQSLLDCCLELVTFWEQNKYINVQANDKRSLDQNSAIRMCYKQIFESRDDMTLIDVERDCKLRFGVPIRRANDPIDEWIYSEILPKLDYERQLKIMDTFAVTSKMSTEECRQYIDIMMIEYPHIQLKTA